MGHGDEPAGKREGDDTPPASSALARGGVPLQQAAQRAAVVLRLAAFEQRAQRGPCRPFGAAARADDRPRGIGTAPTGRPPGRRCCTGAPRSAARGRGRRLSWMSHPAGQCPAQDRQGLSGREARVAVGGRSSGGSLNRVGALDAAVANPAGSRALSRALAAEWEFELWSPLFRSRWPRRWRRATGRGQAGQPDIDGMASTPCAAASPASADGAGGLRGRAGAPRSRRPCRRVRTG